MSPGLKGWCGRLAEYWLPRAAEPGRWRCNRNTTRKRSFNESLWQSYAKRLRKCASIATLAATKAVTRDAASSGIQLSCGCGSRDPRSWIREVARSRQRYCPATTRLETSPALQDVIDDAIGLVPVALQRRDRYAMRRAFTERAHELTEARRASPGGQSRARAAPPYRGWPRRYRYRRHRQSRHPSRRRSCHRQPRQ
jgi:hypothetical protein